MSAQTTIETVSQDEAAVYVDGMGNLYCTYCYHAEIPSLTCQRSSTVDGECYHCGRSGQESIEVVTGTAVIEHPVCKIF